MHRTLKFLGAIVLFLVPVLQSHGQAPQPDEFRLRFPLLFTENAGQWDARVRYAALSPSEGMYFTQEGFTCMSRQTAHPTTVTVPGETPLNALAGDQESGFSVAFVRPSPALSIAASEQATALSNFYHSNDSAAWRSGVANYATLRYRNVWNGIDAEYKEHDGRLLQTFIIHPGADARDIRLRIGGDGMEDAAHEITAARAFSIEGGDTVDVPVARRAMGDGTVGFSLPVRNRTCTTYLSTEFLTYFGGTNLDWGESILLDSAGSIYIDGLTASADFPLKNPQQSLNSGYDVFLAKFDCSAGTLLFSTYYGGSATDGPGYGWFGGYAEHFGGSSMVFGAGSSIYMHGYTESWNLPITPGAILKTNPQYGSNFLARFSTDGLLLYGSYFGPRRGVGFGIGQRSLAMTIGRDSALIVVGGALSEMDCMPPGGYQPQFVWPPSGFNWSAYILRFSPHCDSVLAGTYFGSDRQAVLPTAVTVDSADGIIIAGWTSSTNMPVRNAAFPSLSGSTDAFVAKFDPSLRSLIFSTYLGGKGVDVPTSMTLYSTDYVCTNWGPSWSVYYANAGTLLLDPRGNIVLAGASSSPDFPVLGALQASLDTTAYPYFPYAAQANYPYPDIFLTRLTPDGSLLSSTYFGGSSSDTPTSLFFSSCGNLVLSGYTCSENFPITGSSGGRHTGMFISVFDSACASMRRSEVILPQRPWILRTNSYDYDDWSDLRYLGGYLYLVGGNGRDTATYNAFQDQRAGMSDAMLRRIYYPLCDESYVRCSLRAADTLRLDNRTGTLVIGRTDITLELTNVDTRRTAYGVEGDLTLPPGLVLDPPSQSLHFQMQPPQLPPGQTGRFTWTVRVDSALRDTSSGAISVVAVYRDVPAGAICFPDAAVCAKQVTVLYVPQAPLTLACSMKGDAAIMLDSTRTAFKPNPFSVSCTVKNTSPYTVRRLTVRLTIPPGEGLSAVPPGDTVRIIARIEPDSSVTCTWKFTAAMLPAGRSPVIRFATADSAGVERASCVWALSIERAKLICRAGGPSCILYEDSTRRYSPDPFQVTLEVENPMDCAITGVTADLDLAKSPYFALVDGDSLHRTDTLLSARQTHNFQWQLRVAGTVPAIAFQHLAFRMHCEQYPDSQSCMLDIPIFIPVPQGEGVCTLALSDTLARAPGDTSYAPATLALRCRVENVGKGQLAAGYALLQWSPSSAFVLQDSARRELGALAPGAGQSFEWIVIPRSSRFDRDVACTVIVTAGGKRAASCDAMLHIPAIMRGLACSLAAPDTLQYSLERDSFDPNPFVATFTLRNFLDTAQTAMEAELDLSASPHLRPASGESVRKLPASIPAHGTASLAWTLEVASTPPAPVTERIVVRYRHAGESAWQRCERDIAIGGGVCVARAGCASAGHDTLWADVAYETIIPQPLQVQHTITNTGNVPLAGCTAAIVHSTAYALVDPADSIQSYGLLQPGASASREWLLAVNLDLAQPGTDTISWVWSCDSLQADTTCAHRVTLLAAPPHGVVFSPWLLRFRAERNGPLPAAQGVRLWTGGAAQIAWTMTSPASWIDFVPSSGSAGATIQFRPTTTALAEGAHGARVDVLSAGGASPAAVLVVYEISTSTGTDGPAAARTAMLGTSYPHPAGGRTTIEYTLDRAGWTVITLCDMLGRRSATLLARHCEAGRGSVSFDARSLAAGLYVATLVSGGRAESRTLLVRK